MVTPRSMARGAHFLALVLGVPTAVIAIGIISLRVSAEDAEAGKTKITVEAKRAAAPDSAYKVTDTTICSGGINSSIHQARIKITIDPPPAKTDVIKITLADGGAGIRAHNWRWELPAAKARLAIDGGGTYTFGGSTPLTPKPADTIMATLTSSNYEETTTIKVEVSSAEGAAAATGQAKVGFASPKPDIDEGDGVYPMGVAHDFKVSLKFDGQPVDGHLMRTMITKIHYDDGHDADEEIGLTQFDTTDFSSLVDAGGDGQVAYAISRIDDPDHNSPMMVLQPTIGGFESELADITSMDKDPPPTNALQRDFAPLFEHFLQVWESGDSVASTFAFAGDNGQPGRLKVADALKKLGDLAGRKSYLMKWSVEGDDFPTLVHVTSYSILHKVGSANPEFCATQELFDVKLIENKPYVVGYDVKNMTQEKLLQARTFINRMTQRFNDPARDLDARFACGCSLAIAMAQTADFRGYWETVGELEGLGLADHPEEIVQIRGVLEDTGKDEPVPEKYKNVAERLRDK